MGPPSYHDGFGPRLPPGSYPQAPRPPILDAAAVGTSRPAGLEVRARLLVQHLTAGDPVAVALRFGTMDPEQGRYDMDEVLRSLKVTLTGPDGAAVTRSPTPTASPRPALLDVMPVQLFAMDPQAGLSWAEAPVDVFATRFSWSHLPWEAPAAGGRRAPGLVPGAHRVAISGSVTLARASGSTRYEFTAGPLPFEVAAADADHRTLQALERSAQKRVGELERWPPPARLGSPAPLPLQPLAPTIEDTAGNRWVRFRLEGALGYAQDKVIDVVVDRSGKVLAVNAFAHHACVAEGAEVATPSGAVAIERLQVGDPVLAFDPESGSLTTTRVEAVTSRGWRPVVALRGLRLTADHPVLAGRAFQPALEVGARDLGETRRVYDLSVGWPHTFFAGGVIVHNKMIGFGVGGRARWRGVFERESDP